MEFQRINSYKLRITLTEEEATLFGVDLDESDYDSKEIRERIKDILSSIGAPEFRTEGEKLLVQLYPTRDGGREIFITRLSYISDEKQGRIMQADNLTTLDTEKRYYRISDRRTLLSLYKALLPYDPSLDLYSSIYGEYIISVDGGELNELFLEFADKMPDTFRSPSPEWYHTLAHKDGMSYIKKTLAP